jgi:hypothetical protein
MRKRVFAVVVGLAALAGCGGQTEAEPSPTPTHVVPLPSDYSPRPQPEPTPSSPGPCLTLSDREQQWFGEKAGGPGVSVHAHTAGGETWSIVAVPYADRHRQVLAYASNGQGDHVEAIIGGTWPPGWDDDMGERMDAALGKAVACLLGW